jgi:hypothetical protein
VTVIKRMTYRGSDEEYSSNYWFTGTAPTTGANWRALFDAIVDTEVSVYPSTVEVVAGYGYNDNSGHRGIPLEDVAAAVWSVDLTVSPNTPVPGELPTSGGLRMPGDDAVWCRWKTDRLNSKGKAVFLRKYFHPAYMDASNPPDAVLPNQITNLNVHAAAMQDGSLPGGRHITAAGHTDTIVSHGASTYITTRTLKRRGKRPGA